MMKIPYDNFSKFILRTPIFPFYFYSNITANTIISNKTLLKAFSEPLVKESCFLASPELYFEIEKWANGQNLDVVKEKKIRISLLKYLTRMSTRSTPFGLFAGCAIGEFKNSTSIQLNTAYKNKRHTRLDMNYLVAFAQDLAKKHDISEQLCYFTNTSIYRIANKIRYVEYWYHKSKRRHSIVEVENSEYLQMDILIKP